MTFQVPEKSRTLTWKDDCPFGDAVDEYKEMVAYHNIDIPTNLASKWTEEEIQKMSEVAYNLPHMWTHAIGHDWEEKWTVEDVAKYYRMM